MRARTTKEKQKSLEKHRRAIRRMDEQGTPKTAKVGTVALFIDRSPERQKISKWDSKNPSGYQNDQWHLQAHFRSLLLKPRHS
ncbi:hypothetical protein CDL15_Pgr014210 [Punica granatum]|uniref:Uncharacterized protein n=1 Tax=Punica granatum TaxID=22663 RepID=A0A218XEG8_PUNGR|nr:hypothetical protein CDL15_Pgr014210 [Punica granatum]